MQTSPGCGRGFAKGRGRGGVTRVAAPTYLVHDARDIHLPQLGAPGDLLLKLPLDLDLGLLLTLLLRAKGGKGRRGVTKGSTKERALRNNRRPMLMPPRSFTSSRACHTHPTHISSTPPHTSPYTHQHGLCSRALLLLHFQPGLPLRRELLPQPAGPGMPLGTGLLGLLRVCERE
jgi:hypothetical protein